MGTGWVGVYKWCHAVAKRRGGKLSGDQMIFGVGNYRVLVLHLNGDVAGFEYADGSLVPLPTDGALPCARVCPPPSDSTNELRKVLLSWCGEEKMPPKTVVCMPSKSSEAWVVASLFPNDRAVGQGIECYANPESRLASSLRLFAFARRSETTGAVQWNWSRHGHSSPRPTLSVRLVGSRRRSSRGCPLLRHLPCDFP